jgi:hypothetical protein
MRIEKFDPNKRHNRTDLLAPWFERLLLKGLETCRARGLENLEPFETYRSPIRQTKLWEQGRITTGKIVTSAKAYRSAHQYGLACDLVFKIDGVWTWPAFDDPRWDVMAEVFQELGFETLSFERPHVQIMRGVSTIDAEKISKDQGVLALWNLVELRSRK